MAKIALGVFLVTALIQAIFLLVSIGYNWNIFYPQTQDQRSNEKKQELTERKQTSDDLPKLKLIVAILSAPNRVDRRRGIRLTWMNSCSRKDVLCRFFTDSLTQMSPIVKKELQEESIKHGDLEFMSIPGGINFGLRMLWLLKWSLKNYRFDFFLRIDDDYFLCVKKLLFEIPYRAQVPKLLWGHLHCYAEGQVRMDEGFLLFSYDLVEELVSKRDALLCHPYGDQTVALWINNRTDITRFHDPRIVHEVTAHNAQFKHSKDICDMYLGLHGSYLHEHLIYWNNVKNENNREYWIPSIQPIDEVCKLGTFFDWRKMGGPPYTWEPKLCVLNPTWNTVHKMYLGRNRI